MRQGDHASSLAHTGARGAPFRVDRLAWIREGHEQGIDLSRTTGADVRQGRDNTDPLTDGRMTSEEGAEPLPFRGVAKAIGSRLLRRSAHAHPSVSKRINHGSRVAGAGAFFQDLDEVLLRHLLELTSYGVVDERVLK